MTTLSEYNNNPGNLKPPKGMTYEGQIGVDDKGFAVFENKEYGRKALINDIEVKIKKGVDTPEKFVDRFAPAGPENSEESRNNYKIYLASQLGLKSTTDPFPKDGFEKIADAIGAFEGGSWMKNEPEKEETVGKVPSLPTEGKPLVTPTSPEGGDREPPELPVPIAALAGASLGTSAGTAAAIAKGKYDVLKEGYDIAKGRLTPGATPTPTVAPEPSYGGRNWVKGLTQVDLPGAQMSKADLDLAKGMQAAVGRSGEAGFTGGKITPGGVIISPQTAAQVEKATQATAAPAQAAKRSHPVFQYAGRLFSMPLKGALYGAGTAAALADMYNRGVVKKDQTGAAISGAGALAGSMAPFLPSAGALPAMAVAAPLYLTASDRLKYLEKHPEAYQLQTDTVDPLGNVIRGNLP